MASDAYGLLYDYRRMNPDNDLHKHYLEQIHEFDELVPAYYKGPIVNKHKEGSVAVMDEEHGLRKIPAIGIGRIRYEDEDEITEVAEERLDEFRDEFPDFSYGDYTLPEEHQDEEGEDA